MYTLEEMLDKHVGKKGTPRRDALEEEVNRDVLSTLKKKRSYALSQKHARGLEHPAVAMAL